MMNRQITPPLRPPTFTVPATTVEIRGYRRDRRGARPVRGVLWILLLSPLRRHGEKRKTRVIVASLCCAKVGTVSCGLGESERSVKAAKHLRMIYVSTSRTEAPRVLVDGSDYGYEQAAALLLLYIGSRL